MSQYRSSLHRYMNWRIGWIIWMIQENFKKPNRFSVKLSHVPSQPAVVPSPRSMLNRDRSRRSDTLNLSETQGNVFGNPRAVLDSSQTPRQGILNTTNHSATGGISVQRSTERPVAKGKEQIGSTLPMLSFARRPSTMNSFLPSEIPQNSVSDQQRLQDRSFIFFFDKLPHLQRFHVGR